MDGPHYDLGVNEARHSLRAGPGRLEALIILSGQAVLIAILGGGPSNGFGVFHAPEHDLYLPLIIGGAVDLVSFAALVYWLLPIFKQRRNFALLLGALALMVLANVAAQVAAQSLLIALADRTPKGVRLGALIEENTYGAIATLLFGLIYRFSADWIVHQTRERRMTDRIRRLEGDIAGMRERVERLAAVRGGMIELGAGKSARRFDVDEIFFLKAAGNYTEVHTKAQVHTIYGTLKALAPQLPEVRFARIHRSYVVNLQHVRELRSGHVVLDVASLPIGALQRAEVRAAWQTWRSMRD